MYRWLIYLKGEEKSRMNDENILKHKIKPGQKLPGAGRPKGSLSFKTILEKYLSQKRLDPETGKKLTTKDLIVLKLIKRALTGDPDKSIDLKAIHEILNRSDGLPKQSIDQNINGNITLNFGKEYDGI